MQKTHYLNLQSKPFSLMKSGQKTVEIRLFDVKRQQIKIGDKLIFTNRTTNESLEMAVVKLEHYASFAILYENISHYLLGYNDGENVHYTDMYTYYQPKDEKHFGVIAIYLRTTFDK